MRSRIILSLIASSSLLIATNASAQPELPPRWWFGANASLDYALHRSFTPLPYGNDPAPVHGDGFGFTAGLMGAMRLGGDPDRAAMLVHIGYGTLPASFRSFATTSNGLGPLDEPMQVDGVHRADVSLGLVKSDIQLRLPIVRFGDWDRRHILYLNIGPSIGYVVDGGWTQQFAIEDTTRTLRLVPDENYRSRWSGRDLFVEEETIRGIERWRFGMRAGLTIGIWSNNFYLAPTLSIDYALTPVVKGSSWKAHAIQLGVDLQTHRRFWNWLFGDPYDGADLL